MNIDADYVSSGYISLKPGVGSSLANALRQFKAFWASLLVVTVVYDIFQYLPSFFSYLTFPRNYPQIPESGTSILHENFWLYIVGIVAFVAIFVAIYAVLSYGYALATLKAARGEKPSVKDLFRPFRRFFTVLFSGILWGLILFVGFIFLIIPGIFFACRLVFVPYLVVDRKVGVFDAISGSWETTEGHFWKIFLLGLISYLITIIITIVTFLIMGGFDSVMFYPANATDMLVSQLGYAVIGIPLGLYLALAWGSLYHAIQLKRTETQQVEVEATSSP